MSNVGRVLEDIFLLNIVSKMSQRRNNQNAHSRTEQIQFHWSQIRRGLQYINHIHFCRIVNYNIFIRFQKCFPFMQISTSWIIKWFIYYDSLLMDYLYTLQLNLNSPHLTFTEKSYRVNLKMTQLRREWILHSVQVTWKNRVKIINKMLTPNCIWCSKQDRALKNTINHG